MITTDSGSPDMQVEVVTITPDESLVEACRRLRDRDIGRLVVVGQDGRVVGILSERDVVTRCMAGDAGLAGVSVADCMSELVTTVPVGMQMNDLAKLMEDKHIRHLPVIAEGRPVDVISNRRVLQWQIRRDRGLRDVTVFAMAKLAESRDPEAGGHLERVRKYVVALATELMAQESFADPIDQDFVDMIRVASPLHDIGKVSVPDCVLLKPGKLDSDEWEIMKSHTVSGRDTLNQAIEHYQEADFLIMARDIAAHHHERYDGTGYPDSLAGQDIPVAARIFAVADVYDALISKRVYKPACSHPVARQYICESGGTHFDPVVVAAFRACESEFLAAQALYSGSAVAEVSGKAC